MRDTAISVIVINEVGAIAKMMSFLDDQGINIEAIAGYSKGIGDQGELIFMTNNNPLAIQQLLNSGYKNVSERDVIIVEIENRPGTLKDITELLASKNIYYILLAVSTTLLKYIKNIL